MRGLFNVFSYFWFMRAVVLGSQGLATYGARRVLWHAVSRGIRWIR